MAKIAILLHRWYSDKVRSMKTLQNLSREAVAEFKAIYLEEFGQGLSDDELQEIVLQLLRFFGMLSKVKK